MKREIKFRVWDGEDIVYQGDKYGALRMSISDMFNKFPSTLMQYTGLKDKNGVEIYEGDIIRVRYEGVFNEVDVESEIIWGQKGGFHPNGTHSDSLADFLCDINGVNKSEVIGNIHENPELLK